MPLRPRNPFAGASRVNCAAAGGRAVWVAAGNRPYRCFEAPVRHGVLLDAQDDRA